MISDADLSIVIQGAVVNETYSYAFKLREVFPKAEIILSTWEGTDTTGLEDIVDIVLKNKDPGSSSVPYCFLFEQATYNNQNRQTVSTVAGLKHCSRKYAMKIRTDFVLENNRVLQFFEKYPKRKEEFKVFEKRIVVLSEISRLFFPDSELPASFHVSDFFALGLKEDVLRLFNVPLLSDEELCRWKPKRPEYTPMKGVNIRYAQEQYYFFSAVKQKFPSIRFDDWSDINYEAERLSRKLVFDNFIFVNANQIAIYSKKHQRLLKSSNKRGILVKAGNLLEHRISNQLFEEYYQSVYEKGGDTLPPYSRYLVHKERLKESLKNFKESTIWIKELGKVAINYILKR